MGGVAVEGQKTRAIEDGGIWLAPGCGDPDIGMKRIGFTDGTRSDFSARTGCNETDHRDHAGREPCALVSIACCSHGDWRGFHPQYFPEVSHIAHSVATG